MADMAAGYGTRGPQSRRAQSRRFVALALREEGIPRAGRSDGTRGLAVLVLITSEGFGFHSVNSGLDLRHIA